MVTSFRSDLSSRTLQRTYHPEIRTGTFSPSSHRIDPAEHDDAEGMPKPRGEPARPRSSGPRRSGGIVEVFRYWRARHSGSVLHLLIAACAGPALGGIDVELAATRANERNHSSAQPFSLLGASVAPCCLPVPHEARIPNLRSRRESPGLRSRIPLPAAPGTVQSPRSHANHGPRDGEGSDHVRRNERGGAQDHHSDQERDDRKAHHLTDIEFRNRQQGQ